MCFVAGSVAQDNSSGDSACITVQVLGIPCEYLDHRARIYTFLVYLDHCASIWTAV